LSSEAERFSSAERLENALIWHKLLREYLLIQGYEALATMKTRGARPKTIAFPVISGLGLSADQTLVVLTATLPTPLERNRNSTG